MAMKTKPTKEKVEKAAKELSEAFWRGRFFDMAKSDSGNRDAIEAAILAAAERTKDLWIPSAMRLLTEG